MNDDASHSIDDLIKPLTDEQEDQKARFVEALMDFDDPHEGLNVITFALADFLSQVAPDKEGATGAAAWMMVCISLTLEKWDEQKICNWNETRQ